MLAWMTLSELFKGFTLADIKDMSVRERYNWFELARESGKAVKQRNG